MTDGVTLLRPAASDSDPWSFAEPSKDDTGPVTELGVMRVGERVDRGRLRVHRRIGQDQRLLELDHHLAPESATASSFCFVETLRVTAGASTGDADLGRRNGNAARPRIQNSVLRPKCLDSISANMGRFEGGMHQTSDTGELAENRPGGGQPRRRRRGRTSHRGRLRARPVICRRTPLGSRARCSTRCWSGRSTTAARTVPATCAD